MFRSQVSFSRLTKQQVIGQLKSTNSADPDVLFAAKTALIEPVKPLKIMGIWAYLTGGLMTLTIFLAVLGIPLLFFGWWVRKRGAENLATIEEGYAEYVKSLVLQVQR
jgi:hypothetical protein